MNHLKIFILMLTIISFLSCEGNKDEKKENTSMQKKQRQEQRQEMYGNQSLQLSAIEIDALTLLANEGDGSAAFKLYSYYYIVEGKHDKGIYWIKKAAESGYVTGQYSLAWLYLNDRDKGFRNKDLAKFWLEKASKNGDSKAKELLSMFLSNDDLAALPKKANTGDGNAAFKLYEYYAFISDEDSKAYYWLDKAAENGNVEAQYLVGSRLFNKDKKKAIFWLKKAAAGGHIRAKKSLTDIEGDKGGRP
jgi:uncharacterized protein